MNCPKAYLPVRRQALTSRDRTLKIREDTFNFPLRNEKLDELDDYCTELKAVAEIALEEKPQLLEKFDISDWNPRSYPHKRPWTIQMPKTSKSLIQTANDYLATDEGKAQLDAIIQEIVDGQ